tara:strand:- start:253 stop:528 length:276 start_codon:yes stop_codon:yes gene_type:complete
MSSEVLIKENKKNLTPKSFHSNRLAKKLTDIGISHYNLNKAINLAKKQKSKTCINSLQDRLRKKNAKEKYENRILYGLFISVIAVLFYAST